MSLKACVWKSPSDLKRGKPPLQAKRAILAIEKENFCSTSRSGAGWGGAGLDGLEPAGRGFSLCCGDCLCVDGRLSG